MELLQERIRREGRVLPGNIVKVDGFLNHRVDTRLLEDIADEFAKYFDTSKITVVLTAEASGIAVEKGFQGGGDRFRASGIPYKALAVIEKADENGFVFREE